MKTPGDRPTEIITGLAIAGLVYAYLIRSDLSHELAGLISLFCGIGPYIISECIAAIRRNGKNHN